MAVADFELLLDVFSKASNNMPSQNLNKLGLRSAPIPSSVSDAPTGNPRKHVRWQKVERARDYLQRNADKIAKALVEKAVAGDAQTGRWLMAHIAAMDNEGRELRPVATGIDRPQIQTAAVDNAPRILIGVSLGSDFARLNADQTPRAPSSSADTSR
jgi:hypothetical protein